MGVYLLGIIRGWFLAVWSWRPPERYSSSRNFSTLITKASSFSTSRRFVCLKNVDGSERFLCVFFVFRCLVFGMSFCWGGRWKLLAVNNCIGKDLFWRHAAVLVSSIKVIPSSSWFKSTAFPPYFCYDCYNEGHPIDIWIYTCILKNKHITQKSKQPKQMGDSKNRGTPKWIVYNGKPLWELMIWGFPFQSSGRHPDPSSSHSASGAPRFGVASQRPHCMTLRGDLRRYVHDAAPWVPRW